MYEKTINIFKKSKNDNTTKLLKLNLNENRILK